MPPCYPPALCTEWHRMKPFIKWVGGKGRLIPDLVRHLPADFHRRKDVTYVEPFVGGGAMLFFMLQRYPGIRRAVINDINPDLAGVYRAVRDSVDELVEALRGMEADYAALPDEETRKARFLSVRDQFNAKGLSNVENSACFIFLNKTCFNGLYRVNARGLFNVPFGKYVNPQICDETTLRRDSRLLQPVEILCGDFEHTRDYVSGYTFFYFDPPYRPLDATSCFNSYAREAFNDDEQRRLKRFTDELNDMGCLFLLSNSDPRARHPEDTFFDELYAERCIDRIFAARAVNSDASKRGKISEILVRNYSDTVASEYELFPPPHADQSLQATV